MIASVHASHCRLLAAALLLTALAPAMSACERIERAARFGADSSNFVYAQRHETEHAAVSLQLSHTRPIVADRVELTLSVKADDEMWIDWPEVAEALGDRLRAAGESDVQTRSAPDGDVIETKMYTLEPVIPARTEIPPLTFRLGVSVVPTTKDDQATTIVTEPVPLRIRSVLKGDASIEEAALAPAKGVVDPPTTLAQRLGLGLGAFVLVVAIIWTFVVILRASLRRAKREPTAHARALVDLRDMQASWSSDSEQARRFMERLASILRSYIEAHFNLAATRRTTDELTREALRSRKMNPENIKRITELLRACDLAKFAGLRPTEAQAIETLNRAVEFVHGVVEADAHERDSGAGVPPVRKSPRTVEMAVPPNHRAENDS